MARELKLQLSVVKQVEDEVKTIRCSKSLALDMRILDLLKRHKQNSIFTAPGDWFFASPEKHGKLPGGYTSFLGETGTRMS
jgi:hypothetical protein